MYKVMTIDCCRDSRLHIGSLGLWGDEARFIITWEAADGFEALELLKREKATLVITEVNMQNMCGLELISKIKQLRLAEYVAILTDFDDFESARQCIRCGVFDYILKPAGEAEIRQLLDRVAEDIAIRSPENSLCTICPERAGSDSFYPENKVKLIIELLNRRDDKVTDCISKLADSIGRIFSRDWHGMKMAVQKLCLEVGEAVLERYAWLGKFTDLEGLICIDIDSMDDALELRSRIEACVRELMALLDEFYPAKSKLTSEICDYVIENVDSPISLRTISDAMYRNSTYISTVFKRDAGINLGAYIRKLKMERAKKLLLHDGIKSCELADRLGYKDSEHFSKLFKDYTGRYPRSYKKFQKRQEAENKI